MVAGTELTGPKLGTILPNMPLTPINCVLVPDIRGGPAGGWFCEGSKAVRDAISSGVKTVGMPPARLVNGD